MAPCVSGLTCEPRTLTICCSCTVTVKLHVSGQSRGHTLGKVWVIEVSSARCASYNGMRNCTELYGPMKEPISDEKSVPLYYESAVPGTSAAYAVHPVRHNPNIRSGAIVR